MEEGILKIDHNYTHFHFHFHFPNQAALGKRKTYKQYILAGVMF